MKYDNIHRIGKWVTYICEEVEQAIKHLGFSLGEE